MARPKSTPAYCVHSRSGHAYVTIDGRQIALGKADSPESRQAYDRLIGEWFSNGRTLARQGGDGARAPFAGPTVSIVLEAFWRHAEAYYTRPALDDAGQPVLNPDGTPKRVPSGELECYRHALRPLRRMYATMKAADFGCPELEAMRESMIRPRVDPDTGEAEPGWCRNYANRQMGRVKHVFGWAVTKGLVPVSVHDTLLRLPGLRAGKTVARETAAVKAVDENRALAILPHVSRHIGAMVQVQLLTGMRSTELCIMRPRDIDRSVSPWIYRPMFHKTQQHGVSREVAIGPRAREILETFLKGRELDAYLFSPADAVEERRQLLRARRKTKVQPSQVLRAAEAKQRKRVRVQRQCYNRTSYYNAVTKGCERAFGMPRELVSLRTYTPEVRIAKSAKRVEWHAANRWHPHMIRYRSATDVRKGGGLEAAQVVMGHTSKQTTLIYAEADVARAHEVIERIG